MTDLPLKEESLAVIIGVSECPRAPQLDAIPQCAASAEELLRYLRDDAGISALDIMYLFDSELSSSDQLSEIEDWLIEKVRSPERKYRNVLVYYTGHGGFTRHDQSYFLATRKTRSGSEGHTSIRYVDLSNVLRTTSKGLRKFIILDCCFAASAVLKQQSALEQFVKKGLEEGHADTGTAVLCSSASSKASIAPNDEKYTMFSGALLQCLVMGVPGGARELSMHDVAKAVRAIILKKYNLEAVRPELHIPDQSKGDPAQVPVFPNRAWIDHLPLQPPQNNDFALFDIHLRASNQAMPMFLLFTVCAALTGSHWFRGLDVFAWLLTSTVIIAALMKLNASAISRVTEENFKRWQLISVLGQVCWGFSLGWPVLLECSSCNATHLFFFKGATILTAIFASAFVNFSLKRATLFTFAPVAGVLMWNLLNDQSTLNVALTGVIVVAWIFLSFITDRLYYSNSMLLDFQSEKDNLIGQMESELVALRRKLMAKE